MYFFSADIAIRINELSNKNLVPDEKKLLKYFRKIPKQCDRSVVVSVARLVVSKC